jgi:hypothetical protein
MKAAICSPGAIAACGGRIDPYELLGDTTSIDAKIASFETRITAMSKTLHALRVERQRIINTAARLEAQGLVTPLKELG